MPECPSDESSVPVRVCPRRTLPHSWLSDALPRGSRRTPRCPAPDGRNGPVAAELADTPCCEPLSAVLPPNRATGRSWKPDAGPAAKVTAEAADLPCLSGFAPIHGSTESEAERVRAGTNDRAMARKRNACGGGRCNSSYSQNTLGRVKPGRCAPNRASSTSIRVNPGSLANSATTTLQSSCTLRPLR
jgi:hypothetical protein